MHELRSARGRKSVGHPRGLLRTGAFFGVEYRGGGKPGQLHGDGVRVQGSLIAVSDSVSEAAEVDGGWRACKVVGGIERWDGGNHTPLATTLMM